MTIEQIMNLTIPQFNARLTDIFEIHGHFNSEKGKGRTHKKSFKDIQDSIKQKGIKPPGSQFGLIKG